MGPPHDVGVDEGEVQQPAEGAGLACDVERAGNHVGPGEVDHQRSSVSSCRRTGVAGRRRGYGPGHGGEPEAAGDRRRKVGRVDTEQLVDLLNEDLSSEFQSIVQYTAHVATISGAEYLGIVDELTRHLGQELSHAQALAEQIAFLGGTPTTEVRPVAPDADASGALAADLALETEQLDRYRERVAQANDLGLADVAEALRPLLEQTQEHVRDLRAALGE